MECINIILVVVCFIKLVNKVCGFYDLERLINFLLFLFVDIYYNCYIFVFILKIFYFLSRVLRLYIY